MDSEHPAPVEPPHSRGVWNYMIFKVSSKKTHTMILLFPRLLMSKCLQNIQNIFIATCLLGNGEETSQYYFPLRQDDRQNEDG